MDANLIINICMPQQMFDIHRTLFY